MGAQKRGPGTASLGVRLLIGAILVLAIIWSPGCGLLDPFRVQIADYTFESTDLPSDFDGLRVAFVSDVHLGPTYSEEELAQLVDRVNALDTDLILLGGDYVYTSREYESPCFSHLSRLSAPLGTYAILGNHDYDPLGSSEPRAAAAIRAAADADIPLLQNEGVWIYRDSGRIRLGGVADYKASTSEIGPITEETDGDDFVLLLSHNPDFAEDLPENTVDLVLAGHTHGGQLTLFGVWAPSVPSDYGQKYLSGRVENDVTTVIVSNGIGTSTRVPVRLSAPAQIVVVTLRCPTSAPVSP